MLKAVLRASSHSLLILATQKDIRQVTTEHGERYTEIDLPSFLPSKYWVASLTKPSNLLYSHWRDTNTLRG